MNKLYVGDDQKHNGKLTCSCCKKNLPLTVLCFVHVLYLSVLFTIEIIFHLYVLNPDYTLLSFSLQPPAKLKLLLLVILCGVSAHLSVIYYVVYSVSNFPKSVCLSVLTGTFDKKLNGHQICSVQKTDQIFNEMTVCWSHLTGHFNKKIDSYKIHNFYSCI